MKLLKFIASKVFWKNVLWAILFVIVALFLGWFGLKSYTGHNEFVVVPDVTGMSIVEASQQLDEMELSYLLIDSVWAVEAAPGTILKQEPRPETEVKAGRSIYLTTYRFSPEAVKLSIPEGMNYKIAMIKLRNKGIAVDTVFTPNVLLHDCVIQVKKEGKKLDLDAMVKPGDRVTLVVGRRGKEKVMVPGLYGLTLDSAKKVLARANLSLGQPFFTPEVSTSTDSSSARVYMQEPKPSAEPSARVGSNVDVFLSLNKSAREVPDSLKMNYDK
ncbi:MAG: PASTA domain-containing protein [Flavobacteriales bacterium]|nr:PASTA domain-containing protein [Flavobacteriales bacterium]